MLCRIFLYSICLNLNTKQLVRLKIISCIFLDNSFTEANVLQAIESVSDLPELVINLGLTDGIMEEIKNYAPQHQKQKLVSRLFRIKGDEFNWGILDEAITRTNRGISSTLRSCMFNCPKIVMLLWTSEK